MSPREIVQHMLNQDAFSQWLGISLGSIETGSCELFCTVRDEMLNGHNIAHGGITFSLADSALAFASNTYGNKCVSIKTEIAHLLPVKSGDKLRVKCDEVSRKKTIGTYAVSVTNSSEELVARFHGTVHISSETWQATNF